MSDTSHIQLRHIGLDFTLYRNKTFSIREVLLNPFAGARAETFIALKDLSLEIGHGERVALLGPNGAGKSSLLKIISRIYPATRGEFSVQGRITPLIEMGAGFHHELTGRENIFLNAAILGFSRRQVQERLDRIVDFSEIEAKFLDTPIKYYSSGMQTRLAFAVAVEMDPQILILDEIFSASDAHFAQKASDRIVSSAHIVILVTHDLALARKLAKRAIWLDRGDVVKDGPVESVLADYEKVMLTR